MRTTAPACDCKDGDSFPKVDLLRLLSWNATEKWFLVCDIFTRPLWNVPSSVHVALPSVSRLIFNHAYTGSGLLVMGAAVQVVDNAGLRLLYYHGHFPAGISPVDHRSPRYTGKVPAQGKRT
jgi:hypothetical protein